jgi:hypothetical protein
VSWVLGPVLKDAWPSWTKPFVQEYPLEEDDDDHAKSSTQRSKWALALAFVGICAITAQVALLAIPARQDIGIIINLISWVGPCSIPGKELN